MVPTWGVSPITEYTLQHYIAVSQRKITLK
jgi:hypothetical protein